MISLSTLPTGSEATLRELYGPRSFQRRLMEMGLLPGTRLRLVRRIDVGGVIELEVRRLRLTLRREEAEQLFVSLGG